MNRIPISTYRVQLSPSFGFRAVSAILDYLTELGVTEVYSSPFFAAEPGSPHGYNIVDYQRLNEELGGYDEFLRLSDAMRASGLGLLVDWVPNHMGIGSNANVWWNDVLENGPSAVCASHFDVDWLPPKQSLRDRVLLPILADQYGAVLESGELKLERQGGAFYVRTYNRLLPIRPRSLVPILEEAAQRSELLPSDPDRQELESIMLAIENLPSSQDVTSERRQVRAREKEVAKRRLAELFLRVPRLAQLVDDKLSELNGQPGAPESFDALDTLLREQNYRLAYWQVATEEINYRRFFDVNGLAAIRMEEPAVFAEAHALLLRLVGEHRVTGIRLDHTDGLYNPSRYFAELQSRLLEALGQEPKPTVLAKDLPFYLVAEKILSTGESLPLTWRIAGTTGYDFLGGVNALWVDPQAESPLSDFHRRFTGVEESYEDLVRDSKRAIIAETLSSEVNMLGRALERIAEANRRSRDFTLISLTRAIGETLVAFRVYRTYLQEDGSRESADDEHIQLAIRRARRERRDIPAPVFAFLRDVLLLRPLGQSAEQQQARVQFTLRFQQLLSAVMAKAVEDTAFYRYARLVSLNEVGSDPAAFGSSVVSFHHDNLERLHEWPLSLTATASHDTKRGEDARARISVLSEMPVVWRRAVARWSRLGRVRKTSVGGELAPTRSDEYLFYQSLVGSFPYDWTEAKHPEFIERMCAFMLKAIREAKQNTSWLNPSPEYESATSTFVEKMLLEQRFLLDLRAFCDLVAPFGVVNSLSQVLLKLCAPGIPDVYQGCELWDQSFVDPDNRRPVDYALRRELLAQIRQGLAEPKALAERLLGEYQNGAVKLYVLHVGLTLRRHKPELFWRGSYRPLSAGEHAIAFARQHGSDLIVCCVPRFSYRLTVGKKLWPLGDIWGDDILLMPTDGTYRNVFTGEKIHAGRSLHQRELFATFPVALLAREE